MKTGPKFLLSAIALLAAVWVVLALAGLGGGGEPPQEPAAAADASPPPAAGAPSPRVAPGAATGPGTGTSTGSSTAPAVRTEVLTDDLRDRGDQGFSGRVVDASGTPVEGAEVYLFANHANDVFSAMLLAQKGVVVPPVAKDITGRDGRFELRVRSTGEAGFEIRAISALHADAVVPNLTLFEARVVDVADVRLPRGLSLTGRVAVFGGSDFPIPNALVRVQPAGLVPSLLTTPGREDGIETRTDSAGRFRIDNLTPGFFTVAAVAPGFARIEREAVEIRSDVENRVDFELPKGLSLAGRVSDRSGRPIEGARVEAVLIDARRPSRSSTRSDVDGRFEVLGLVDGPYVLSAVAPGHVEQQQKPVRAGATDLVFELPEQGSVWLTVTDPDGRELRRYQVLLRAHHAEHDTLGNVLTAQVEPVVPGDLEDGRYRLRNVDPGAYVVQLDAPGWARTFSPPFSVEVDGEEEPQVDVRMRAGGILEGRVVTTDGRPLRDVVVSTLPRFFDDSPFAGLVAGMVPTRLTEARAHTDADGRYELTHLAEGSYLVRFERSGFATAYAQDVEIGDGERRALADQRLELGVEVWGTVTVDAAPAGQVKISIMSEPEPGAPDAPTFQASAVSDNDGRFSLSRRLPPGRYQAQAARQTLPNPILQVVDYQKTRRSFVITSGQRRQELHFALTSD